MEKNDYIEKLAAMKARYGKWKDEDRTELKAMVKELGIKHSFRGRCSSCYNDAFHLVMNHLGLLMADLKQEPKKASGKWVYVGNAPAQWHYINGTVVLDENTPDDIVERFVAAFPNQKKYELNTMTEETGVGAPEEHDDFQEVNDGQDVQDEFNEQQITF